MSGYHRNIKTPALTRGQIFDNRHRTQNDAAEALGVASCTLSRYCALYDIRGIFVKNLLGDDITKKEMLSCDGLNIGQACVKLGVSRNVLRKLINHFDMIGFFGNKKA